MGFRIPLIIAFFALLTSDPTYSQEFRIRDYGLSQGISNLFVYTVNQDARGFIWAGTGEGILRFDGFSFTGGLVTDSLANGVASVSYRDERGVLWFGYQGGNILRYDGENFRMYYNENVKSSVTGFGRHGDGTLAFSTLNDGVYTLVESTGEITSLPGIEDGFYTSLLTDAGRIILGMQEGLTVYETEDNGQTAVFKTSFTDIEYTRINDIARASQPDQYWIATGDQGLYLLNVSGKDYVLEPAGEKLFAPGENIQSVSDENGEVWVSSQSSGISRLTLTPEGLYVKKGVYNEENLLSTNIIKETFRDHQGNIWVSTFGKGLSIMIPQAFAIHSMQHPDFNNNVLAVAEYGEQIYAGSDNGLFVTPASLSGEMTKLRGIPDEAVTALYRDEGSLWIGTASNGLYIMSLSGSQVSKVAYTTNSLGRTINHITGNGGAIYAATRDGIYIFDRNGSETAHLTTSEGGLPYNNIQYLFTDSRGRMLFATQTNGIYQLTANLSAEPLYRAGDMELEFTTIAEDQEGNLWAGTRGEGVFYFRDDTVMVFNEGSGLMSSFCYSLVNTSDNNIWIGHSNGLSRINTDNFRISTYDVNTGVAGSVNQNAILVLESGKALIGTNEGVFTYDPSLEQDYQQPPFTNLTRLTIFDRPYDITEEIILPYGRYKIRIDFIGLNYGDPHTVTYQYRLDGYETEWSDVTSLNYVNYPRIEDGNYTFYVRSYNNEGLSEETPVSFNIIVRKPFWKTIWFFILAAGMLFGSVYFYIKYRERKQRELQEYLERELDARTREVVEQKEEIEIKNRDITDSINYARRIQSSMLPPIKKLQQYFSGSFIFYNPRDIVSGDFYWFDRVSESKFVIVCADSTGHGVPGAFMSMIGSTLIKDICTRANDNSPGKVLQALDTELSNTLNHNLEDGTKPSDGMDIIVCEIDLKTFYMRYASAMRPMIVYKNGEEIFIPGSRNSIGGHYEREDNIFIDEGLQLSKGDIVYLFSDGYSDQFGGPMGKKFKMVRLKNLLQDIHHMPMEEQFSQVCNNFNLWKENYAQVDDVLFMGIKL